MRRAVCFAAAGVGVGLAAWEFIRPRLDKPRHPTQTTAEKETMLDPTEAPSYQTAPLGAYRADLQELAERLFQQASNKAGGLDSRKYKGSYSFLSHHDSVTLGKIVIIQQGLGKKNGTWHEVEDGVYALFRASQSAGRTMGIAPKHNERFTLMKVQAGTLDETADALAHSSKS